MGQREYNMSVGRREQFGASRREPAVARLALAFRAVPVATRVVGDGAITAAGALVCMAAHRGGAASLDGDQDSKMQPGEPRGRPVHEMVAHRGYDIGQLQERPLHSLLAASAFRVRGCRKRQRIERAGGGFQMPL